MKRILSIVSYLLIFFLVLFLRSALHQSAHAQTLQTCCLFITFDFHAWSESVELEAPNSISNYEVLRLAASRKDDGYPKCETLGELMRPDMHAGQFYTLAMLFRICESLVARDGFFSVHHYGGFPYQELDGMDKFRFRFYTRASDFSIAFSQGMSLPQETYLQIDVTVNLNPSFTPDNSNIVVATLDCDGAWRNFFQEPQTPSDIFREGAQEFSITQNDQCETLILNQLKQVPQIAKYQRLDLGRGKRDE